MKSTLLSGAIQPGESNRYSRFSFARNLSELLLMLGLVFTGLNAHADGNYEKHPILDRDPKTYESDAQISALPTDELKVLRSSYAEALNDTSKSVLSKEQAEEQLLQSLFAYDDVRVDIINVIPLIIKDYDIQSPTSDRLAGFGDRFRTVHAQRSSYVESLKDYRGYDFQQGMSYASMMAVFFDNQELYDQLHHDMTNPKTSIGAYIDHLNSSYMNVEKARMNLDKVIAIEEVQAVLARIDENFKSRE